MIVMKLTINMRILRMATADAIKAQAFADFLISIGEGTENNVYDESDLVDLIQLSDEIASKITMTELINKTFPDLSNMYVYLIN